MTINGLLTEGDPHGTFDSQLLFTFDVTGSISGAIQTGVAKTLEASGEGWRHSPSGQLVIDGLNHNLNGVDESGDFWSAPGDPLNGLEISHASLPADVKAAHVVIPAVPEPGTGFLLGAGLISLAFGSRRLAGFSARGR